MGRGAHRAGVVTLEPLDGEASELFAEWRGLRGEEGWRGSAFERTRADERRWELEVELIAEHGLALPPETEPLHPSRRDDQLRWRQVTLRRVHRQRVRAERLRLLRRILTFGLLATVAAHSSETSRRTASPTLWRCGLLRRPPWRNRDSKRLTTPGLQRHTSARRHRQPPRSTQTAP